MEFKDATKEEIGLAMQKAWKAFLAYRALSLKQRANFMRAIASEIEAIGDELINTASSETALPADRLINERTRTLFQLRSYADAAERGDHLDVRIDEAHGDKPSMAKMMFPLGPVVVFGAANFPFAYSTAGGDTACALAAGCPVIVKAHPDHAATSTLVAEAALRAAALFHLPEGVFTHLYGASTEVGRQLVQHPYTKAVGFTGSFAGGKQLFDWANQRKVPIPVFAEMSSINPVFLFPGKLKEAAIATADELAASITLGDGQFCTNPGLMVAIESEYLDQFITRLQAQIVAREPGTMLNTGIFKNYVEKRGNAIAQLNVETVAVAEKVPQFNQGVATLAETDAHTFIANPLLHQEVFGPYSLLVKCRDAGEMMAVAGSLEGQLSTTLMATPNDLAAFSELASLLQYNCGRFIWNGVPTGVNVSLAMQHGGPFPATTDSRFTAVGADGIRRFVRPVAFQNWPDELLPEELRKGNPARISRTVNDRRIV